MKINLYCFLLFSIVSLPVVAESDMFPNGKFPLLFNNYLGNAENIHPKVLYFENGWKGYEFWMAYTPYPKGQTSMENPCIAVSHDGFSWFEPVEGINPLYPCPENGYNSDTHLVYDSENDCLEIWWRPYDRETRTDRFCRRITYDGITWTEPEITLPSAKSDEMRLSPAVHIENDEYVLVYRGDSRSLKVVRADRDDPELKWSEPKTLPVDWGDLTPWHQDLIVDEDGNWELVVCCYTPGNNSNSADLYYVKLNPESDEPASPRLILSRGEEGDFDSRSIYRSSIVKVDGKYYIYYSAIDADWNRAMSLLIGDSIESLEGYVPSDTGEPELFEFEPDDSFPPRWFDLSGRSLNTTPSSPGLYIRKNGNKSEKLMIKSN